MTKNEAIQQAELWKRLLLAVVRHKRSCLDGDYTTGVWCLHCAAPKQFSRDNFEHQDNCPFMVARKALALKDE